MCFLTKRVLRNSGGCRITEQGYLRILSNSNFPPNSSLSGKLPSSSAPVSLVPLPLLSPPLFLFSTLSPSPGHSFSPSPPSNFLLFALLHPFYSSSFLPSTLSLFFYPCTHCSCGQGGGELKILVIQLIFKGTL